MSKRLVIILWSLAGVLAAMTIIVKSSQNDSGQSTELATGDLLLDDLKLEQVTRIKIEDGEHTSTVTKAEEGWTLEERDFPANFDKLFQNLKTLKEVTVTQNMKAGPAYDERFGMDATAKGEEEHGIYLTFLDAKGNELEQVKVGKATEAENTGFGGRAQGKYVRLGSEPSAVYVVNDSFFNLSADPKDWLKPGFISVQGAKKIDLALPNEEGEEGWTLTRESVTDDFTMENVPQGLEALPESLTSMKSVLSSASFQDVLSEEEAKEKRDESKARQLVVETFDGFRYVIDFAPEKVTVPENLEEGTITPATSESYILTFKVSADLPDEREKGQEEDEAQAKAADEAFEAEQERLKTKLAEEQSLAGRWFSVAKWTLDSVNKPLSDLTKPVAKTEAKAPTEAPKAEPTPAAQPREVVTPPIAIPPLEAPAEDAGEEGEEPAETNNSNLFESLGEEDIKRIAEEAARADQAAAAARQGEENQEPETESNGE